MTASFSSIYKQKILCLLFAIFSYSAVHAGELEGALSKKEWGGHDLKTHKIEKKQYKDIGKIKHISVHYTQSRPRHKKHSERELLRFVQEGHQGPQNRFGDIAYHYLIGMSGTIYKGRDHNIAPASKTHYYSNQMLRSAKYNSEGKLIDGSVPNGSAPGHTEGHITVTFILGLDEPKIFSEKTMNSAANVIAELLIKHGLKPDAVRAHREIAKTDCPGGEVYTWLRGPNKRMDSEGTGMKLIRKRYSELSK